MSTWSKPNVGSVKVNVKGVFKRSQMRSAVACVIRDSDGQWVRGCKSMIGLAVSITAAMWSIFYGLKLAWEHQDKSVLVESDCEEAVNLVLNPNPDFEMYELICMINNIMSESWVLCELIYILSSANIAVAALANNAISDDGGIDELTVLPSIIRPILAAEKMA
ncbi:uncharacterized protein LOC141665890 [Apium graveolens]|uniref:uncharacterized protein LOC141665890 n=1 Tax=Apium graveolens TaxID=4045 RepID=UPI003D7B52CF